MRRVVLGLLFAGCARAQPVAAPVVQAPREAAVQEVESRAEAPDVEPRVWFKQVSAGTCKPMRLVAHGSETYLSFGTRGTFVRRLADESLVDLSLGGVMPYGSMVVKIEAVFGEDMIVMVQDVGWTAGGVGFFFRRHANEWTRLDDDVQREVDGLVPWLDGSVLVSGHARDPVNKKVSDVRELQAFGGTRAAPALPEFAVADSVCRSEFKFTADADGRLLVSGRGCGARDPRGEAPWTVIRWSPADGASREQLPLPGDDWRAGPVAMVGPTRMFATAILGRSTGYRTIVASFDGAAWTQLSPVDGAAAQIEVDAEGRPWLRMAHGRLMHWTADGRWTARTLTGTSVREFGGLRGAWAWVLTDGGGLWVRPAGGEFVRARLMVPELGGRELRAEQVSLVGDDLWVAAGYDSQYPVDREVRRNPCVLLMRSGDLPAAK